jgi:hypothetical protein
MQRSPIHQALKVNGGVTAASHCHPTALARIRNQEPPEPLQKRCCLSGNRRRPEAPTMRLRNPMVRYGLLGYVSACLATAIFNHDALLGGGAAVFADVICLILVCEEWRRSKP